MLGQNNYFYGVCRTVAVTRSTLWNLCPIGNVCLLCLSQEHKELLLCQYGHHAPRGWAPLQRIMTQGVCNLDPGLNGSPVGTMPHTRGHKRHSGYRRFQRALENAKTSRGDDILPVSEDRLLTRKHGARGQIGFQNSNVKAWGSWPWSYLIGRAEMGC